jgi:hypothetical protein
MNCELGGVVSRLLEIDPSEPLQHSGVLEMNAQHAPNQKAQRGIV